jgi:cytochrome c556
MRRSLTIAFAAFGLASCRTTSEMRGHGEVETHTEMVGAVNPAFLTITEVSDAARSESEGLDPALMSAAAWARLQAAARSLQASSWRMGRAGTLRVGAHTAEEPGFAGKAEIQRRIDADPKWFREIALKMAEQAGELEAATRTRDLRRTRDLTQGLNASCQTCHTRYWERPRG